jgi:cell division transport system permease protein
MSNRYLKNTIAGIKRERLMSLTNIFVMTITFFVLGVFVTIVVLTQTILRNLEQQAQVTIFFKDEVPDDTMLSIKGNLEVDDRIIEVAYVSKADAYNIFKELNKDDPVLLESVTSSILPASLEVRARDISNLPKLAEEFGSLDGVEEVRFYEDVISRFRQFSNIAYALGFSLVFVFLLISYSVVLSTLRNTIHSKGTELEILKLVGATNAYVKTPLLYQGVFYGLASSLIAGTLLFIGLNILGTFSFMPDTFELGILTGLEFSVFVYSVALFVVMIISGGLLGFLGSSFAVKRYLKY